MLCGSQNIRFRKWFARESRYNVSIHKLNISALNLLWACRSVVQKPTTLDLRSLKIGSSKQNEKGSDNCTFDE